MVSQKFINTCKVCLLVIVYIIRSLVQLYIICKIYVVLKTIMYFSLLFLLCSI